MSASQNGKQDATVSEDARVDPRPTRERARKVRLRRVASSLLFQSTALAGTFAGLPIPVYSRAYAQSVSCNTPQGETASNINTDQFKSRDDTISGQTITCTISGSLLRNSPALYFYAGPYLVLKNPGGSGSDTYRGHTYPAHSNWSWDSPNITVTNHADIYAKYLNNQAPANPLYSGADRGNLRIAPVQANGLSVVSLGALNWNGTTSGDNGDMRVGAGSGGTVTIVNTGDVWSPNSFSAPGQPTIQGGGIFALSMGGTNKHADGTYPQLDQATSGSGGDVTVTSTGTVGGAGFGIAALSIGGPGTYVDDSNYFNGGPSGKVQVTVNGSDEHYIYGIYGPAIAAVSYSGNTPYNLNSFDTNVHGGPAYSAQSVTVIVGSADNPMSGTISSKSSGAIYLAALNETVQLTRKTGAGIFAISRGGDGINRKGPKAMYGGAASSVSVSVYGTSSTSISTQGDQSPGILAISQGGASMPGTNGDKKGRSGAPVTVLLSGGGSIETSGDYSSGIVAQSLGGGGTDTYGRGKGEGASSADVTVSNDFAITTQGIHSAGIVAQSIAAAADAGSAYVNSNSPVTLGDTSTYGSTSGAVTVTNSGEIKVHGADSHGILAQSIGGGGGTLRSTGGLGTTTYGSVAVLQTTSPQSGTYQTIGGQSSGANGYAVTVTNTADITTYGGYSSVNGSSTSSSSATPSLGGGIAILAQSLGGGGGTNTGLGTIGSIGPSSNSEGDNGSNGGQVTVKNSGSLTTRGSEAHGIVAQSIGGGGGVGRNRKGLFHTVGGNGGSGGGGGYVLVEQQDGAISVSGDYAMGVVAQSIGGGGGAGGQATDWGLFFSSATGGKAGGGGYGGKAKVNLFGNTSTGGDHGTGILVQSIGGGGGIGGNAKSKGEGLAIGVSIAHGGSGGGGGGGGDAQVFLNGSVTTAGLDSQAIVLQSIGGGGGNGGQATTKAIAEGVPINEDVTDTVSLTVSIAHGGSGGNGGHGGAVYAKLYNGSSISTAQDGSGAIVAQSIGGGGGNGGDSTASSAAKTMNEVFDDLKDADADFEDDGDGDDGDAIQNFSLNIDVSLGGSGGGGGYGGTVTVYNNGGSIVTHGGYADAILAQSIGGGGGNAGTGSGSTKNADGIQSAGANISLGNTGGGGGNGGVITIGQGYSNASITTYGHVSRGIFAQSIGGGGGNSSGGGGAGDADWKIGLNLGTGANGTKGGDGGNVTVWNEGSITTHGDWSDGILVQSIGGGGGAAGSGKSSLSIKYQEKEDSDDDGGDDAEADADADRVTAAAADGRTRMTATTPVTAVTTGIMRMTRRKTTT